MGFFNLAVFAMLVGGVSEEMDYVVVVVVAERVSFAKGFLEISKRVRSRR